MKRKLFFWVDKLQIRRSERIAISMLMILISILLGIGFIMDTEPSVDDDAYAELERVFRERSNNLQQEHETIMARYTPIQEEEAAAGPEIAVDTQSNVKKFENPEPEREKSDTLRININKADAEELQKLPGIGPAYSVRIVEWRNTHGEFTHAEQLLEIRGIGPARLEKIKPMIVL